MQTDFTVPHGGILILSMDINPYTNNAVHYNVTLLSEDNGETIKQLVQEYITIPLQGVQAL